ncbi:hypothetical protein [Paraburkholderia dilworthii]|uniref:DUF4229 domain-containing protein n=1 Tax=Paraburkholderia dilworthii TaxID=948106 RepID=A0ABW9D8T3_9BURK
MPSLATFADAFRFARLYLFLLLLAVSAWQVLTLLRSPSDARLHVVVAGAAAIVAARLYLAKKSSLNRALADIERLAARRNHQEV